VLSGLANIGLIEQVDDALRDKRTVFRIAEPVVRLHQLIVFRREPELLAGRGHRVWESAAETVGRKIYGRHFEDLARRWCFEHASEDTLGGSASRVRRLLLFSRSGFNADLLRVVESRGDVELIDLHRLYRGD
jgi:hypothetical protein